MSWNSEEKKLPDKKRLFKKRRKRNRPIEKGADDARIYYPSDFASDIAWNYGARETNDEN